MWRLNRMHCRDKHIECQGIKDTMHLYDTQQQPGGDGVES